MNIFARELKKNFVSFLIWFTICGLMTAYIIFMFPSFKTDIVELLNLKFPPQMQKAFGLNTLNFNNVLSFLGVMVPYIILLGGIYGGILFGGIVSKEENDGTIEFLLSKPVSRMNICLSKLFAANFYIAIFTLLNYVVAFLSMKAIKADFSLMKLLELAIGTWLAILIFGFVCFLLSMFVYRSRTLIPIAVGIVAGTYILKAVSEINEKSGFLKYLSPFHYFDASTLISEGINPIHISISIIVIIGSFIAGLLIYENKDFKA
jgi:ABC-2 type transport system permease protein